jgi:hypothetical protein
MNGVQPTASEATFNQLRGESEIQELGTRHDTMLVPGQLPCAAIRVSKLFTPDMGTSLRNSEIAPFPSRFSC